MQLEYSTPVLISEASNGKATYWQGHIAHEGDKYFTYTSFWQDLADGGTSKVQESVPTEMVAKNVGRANELSLKDQAYFEMNSLVKKKKDKGNYELGAKKNEKARAMLALTHGKVAHRITFPCTEQPKFNGNRAMSDGNTMWSRMRIDFIPEVIAHLVGDADTVATPVPRTGQITMEMLLAMDDNVQSVVGKLNTLGYTCDGELLMPHIGKRETALQATNSAIKKFNPLTSPKLLYRIYDVVVDKPYPERYEICKQIVAASNNPQILLAPVRIVNDEEDIFTYHADNIANGWEGTILRLHEGGYKEGQRVVQLIKLKDFFEEEYQVIGVKENDRGKYKGTAKLVCVTDKGEEFSVLPMGTIAQKKHIFEHPETVLGTWWVVRFWNYTEKGIPQHAQGVCERDPQISG